MPRHLASASPSRCRAALTSAPQPHRTSAATATPHRSRLKGLGADWSAWGFVQGVCERPFTLFVVSFTIHTSTPPHRYRSYLSTPQPPAAAATPKPLAKAWGCGVGLLGLGVTLRGGVLPACLRPIEHKADRRSHRRPLSRRHRTFTSNRSHHQPPPPHHSHLQWLGGCGVGQSWVRRSLRWCATGFLSSFIFAQGKSPAHTALAPIPAFSSAYSRISPHTPAHCTLHTAPESGSEAAWG